MSWIAVRDEADPKWPFTVRHEIGGYLTKAFSDQVRRFKSLAATQRMADRLNGTRPSKTVIQIT